jgi:hypothetical protein
MSAVTHYSEAPDGTIPKRLLCGKRPKDGTEWTRCWWLVECTKCNQEIRKIGDGRRASAAGGEA